MVIIPAVVNRFTGTVLLAASVTLSASAVDIADDAPPWSLRPLEKPVPPRLADAAWIKTPIDAFILAKLGQEGLDPSPPADKRTLIRRVYFDLIGLPPKPENVTAFLADESPAAFAKIVDRLLASPRYGERWARHWMDVVHYAETHGHDEDAIRENAWPYRDYLIRSFNEDKPYGRFVKEQIAGDVLYPDDPWATAATGFLACGPWDESSQMGIQDGTTDKKVAQYLDRDDMITTAMSTFVSATAHCARCHDHKFDPISMGDYYALQAVFAGIDRVDRPYEPEPARKRRRETLLDEKRQLDSGQIPDSYQRDAAQREAFSAWELQIRETLANWAPLKPLEVISEGGATAEVLPDASLRFGGERPERDTYRIRGVVPLERITAFLLEVMTDDSLHKRGPGRQDNGNLHLSEIKILAGDESLAIADAVADFNQGGWTIAHAIDGNPKTAWGIYPEVGKPHRAMFVLDEPLEFENDGGLAIVLEQLHGGGHLIGRPRISATHALQPTLPAAFQPDIHQVVVKPQGDRTEEEQYQLIVAYLRGRNATELAGLDKPPLVYAVASNFSAKGNFKPAGKPRPVHLLERGDINAPGDDARPGGLTCVAGVEARFDLAEPGDEGARRAALAEWLVHSNNVLIWRSIANRVWHYHFGRGIVATPNDFGAMGAKPTHPDLLDWLAFELRAHAGSLKWLHRTICTSTVYQQSSVISEGTLGDAENRFLSRGTRRRLDAESIRDAVLQMSGKLDLTMGGPSVRQFHASKGVHVTPVLDYLGFDPDDPANFRRSVYRFVFRTVPDPLMAALDCPDASQLAPKREVSITALQALAMLNNRFLVRQCEHLAARFEGEAVGLDAQITRLFEFAYNRPPNRDELAEVSAYAGRHGLANACRVIINSSEFVFVN